MPSAPSAMGCGDTSSLGKTGGSNSSGKSGGGKACSAYGGLERLSLKE